MDFELTSQFQPTGDQPQAIDKLVSSIEHGDKAQVLLGVTGSGKTFTIANTIARLKRPALILSHNKTLAAQLFGEFKQFFPHNAVEYYVSYYDYYQPEAYLPASNTYIEKDLSINEEIEKLRLSALASLLSGRRDVIVVSSVSCIYGTGNPADYHENIIILNQGEKISQRDLMLRLVKSLYSRHEMEFSRGKFRVKGDTIDVFVAYDDYAYRIIFFDEEIESIYKIDPLTGTVLEELQTIRIYPANMFVPSSSRIQQAIKEIQLDLGKQVEYFREIGRPLEAKRLEDRVTYDVEMIKELGFCSGIENYSRYFDGREAGTRPFCLLDYFPDDYLTVIDESHVTVPQIGAMYGGDRSRKVNLVEYGFRLPAALDNRPLKFDEYEALTKQVIYVSATPADYELEQSGGVVVEQLIRPTGLLDPEIQVRPTANQVDDLLDEIEKTCARGERVLVTTLTKKMAEELAKYFANTGIRCAYIHSEVDTLDRVEILQDLRAGAIDVLIGVNLLREGLDLPEVSLVAILDADKEGFLRSARSLTQTAGRAARNIHGLVIMYADHVTEAMQQTIDETYRRRQIQDNYNKEHHITPQPIVKAINQAMNEARGIDPKAYSEDLNAPAFADPVMHYEKKPADIAKRIAEVEKLMKSAAAKLEFIEADNYLQELNRLKELQSKAGHPLTESEDEAGKNTRKSSERHPDKPTKKHNTHAKRKI
ncbi:MAG: excinuclease ABC subunit UvrB [Bacteroidetes bacterium]|uniref:UvrABC system protein B n=1 Tax=Candidatus Pullibacteroides excrementavium TaxID=2840905 RepID=A0A9D9DTW8_9BACT|nr:excinuclease ABC subunit UvrB [Candidatus Pullibacteroides excrementavium]